MFLLSMRRFLLPALVLFALLAPAAAHAQDAPATPARPWPGTRCGSGRSKKSSRGSVSAIARAAKRYGIENLVIKGADGTKTWRQFYRRFVNGLRARGLKVCAYQFVYGAAATQRGHRRGPDRPGAPIA